jgi:hypothetical protein
MVPLEDGAIRGPTRSGKAKSETISVRLDARLRYLVELAARRQRRTLSSYVAWAVEDSLSRVLITEEVDPRGNSMGKSVSEVAMALWDPEGPERLVRLALQYPELLTYHEQILWRLIRENRYLWKQSRADNSTQDLSEADCIWERLHETWDTFNAVARGDEPKSKLPAGSSSPSFDEGDPSS